MTEQARKRRSEKRPSLSPAGLVIALVRRPVLWLVGMLICGITLLLEDILGGPGEALFNLASYIPFLGGGWAVYAHMGAKKDEATGHFPPKPHLRSYIAAALMVIMASGLARITLTILGELVVKTALALGPTIALADRSWPHRSLWRGLIVIDEFPRECAKIVGLSAAILILTVLLVPTAFNFILSSAHQPLALREFIQGVVRGMGWAIVSAIWMRFYLKIRREV